MEQHESHDVVVLVLLPPAKPSGELWATAGSDDIPAYKTTISARKALRRVCPFIGPIPKGSFLGDKTSIAIR
jgi:hypothetical protein